ncbi:hypothetical protein RDWZM_002692 [Blomia tropicalis]|uniref:Uncharacterized protein n=1 Tax=Blomia tropicalis TaxID=40697 RepID=A0A9Q0MGS6_BLOTA|nr:hypothetical protein BLOT_001454 [Blomia tropicalis]KAJ6224147.1 hypothetical protein RDWZM_002692 [Blomia tropicalis]
MPKTFPVRKSDIACDEESKTMVKCYFHIRSSEVANLRSAIGTYHNSNKDPMYVCIAISIIMLICVGCFIYFCHPKRFKSQKGGSKSSRSGSKKHSSLTNRKGSSRLKHGSASKSRKSVRSFRSKRSSKSRKFSSSKTSNKKK